MGVSCTASASGGRWEQHPQGRAAAAAPAAWEQQQRHRHAHVVLDGRAGHVRQLGRQRVAGGLESRKELDGHRVPQRRRGRRGGRGAVRRRHHDVEPVASGVEEAVHLHEVQELRQRPPRDDARVGHLGQLAQRPAHPLGQQRLGRVGHDRRQRAVVIQHDDHAPPADQPRQVPQARQRVAARPAVHQPRHGRGRGCATRRGLRERVRPLSAGMSVAAGSGFAIGAGMRRRRGAKFQRGATSLQRSRQAHQR